MPCPKVIEIIFAIHDDLSKSIGTAAMLTELNYADLPRTLSHIHSKLYRSFSLPFFLEVLGMKKCRLWLSHDTTMVPSVTMVCRAVFGQGQHSSGPTTNMFPRYILIGNWFLEGELLPKINSHFRGTRLQENVTKQLLAIAENEFQ